ncbi:MAG: PilN domain-containing protein [Colwellia sp.]|nr:PilN domain-containing protein [Colwellia sp.]
MPVNPKLSSGVNGSVNKFNINLLQAELLPEKILLTLPRVVVVWFLVFFVMTGWAVAAYYTQQSFQSELTILQQEDSKKTKLLATLTAQLSARKVDSQLTDRLATIKLLMANKQALHAKLTDSKQTYVAGFSAAMDELAQLHHRDIRLEAININNDNMTFSGVALTPEAVPAWLAGFENSVLLSGKSFSHFELSENEQNIIKFMVSSKITGVSIHE